MQNQLLFSYQRKRRQKRRKEWITADTWQAIKSRRALKNKVMDTTSNRLKQRYRKLYQEADQTMKRMTRADKRAYMESSQAEEGGIALQFLTISLLEPQALQAQPTSHPLQPRHHGHHYHAKVIEMD